MANQLDEAFNWLVLILTTIAGALSDFPQLYPLHSPRVELAIVRLSVFPAIVLVFLWLSSHLVNKVELQVVVKSFSWIFASIILMADLALLLLGTYQVTSLPVDLGHPLTILASGLIIFSPLYFPLLFCLIVVRPRMRETYKDSRFLYSLPKQALLYVGAVLSYLLAAGIVEEILFGVGVI